MHHLYQTVGAMQHMLAISAIAIHGAGRGASAALVSQRQQFAELCGDFLVDLQHWLRETGDAATFVRLQDEFDAMRAVVIEHQCRWTPQAIARNRMLYLLRVREVTLIIQRFLNNCFATLAFAPEPAAA